MVALPARLVLHGVHAVGISALAAVLVEADEQLVAAAIPRPNLRQLRIELPDRFVGLWIIVRFVLCAQVGSSQSARRLRVGIVLLIVGAYRSF